MLPDLPTTSAPVRILHLEDDANDHKLLRARLIRDQLDAEIVQSESEEQFRAALADSCFDIILSDYNLPSYNGQAALLLAKEICPGVPFLIVSGVIGENAAVEIVKLGATDYVPKDHLEKLAPAIERALREANERKARVEAEQALRLQEIELRSSLERLVAQRTHELMRANEQLQGFTYSVAHDLRQQIRGINGNASMLLQDCRDVLDDDSSETLQRLADSARKLGTLVDDLLTYARLGKHVPTTSDLDMSAIATEIAEHLSQGETYSNTTRYVIEPHLRGKADLSLMRIVLENLLDNASKYSSLSTNPVVEVGQSATGFFVRDNGIGFEMEFVGKLFQPFERLHSESIYPGTGMGLANVKRIVELHGGSVWAEGEPNKGATFYFSLPT
jgi:signal transduction histidine kinase